MISTGGTIEAAARASIAQGATGLIVTASHGLFVGPAPDRLAALPVARVIVSDSLPQRVDQPFTLEVARIAPLLASAIRADA